MAGPGMAPKPPDKRVRTNKDPIPHTKLEFHRAQQPPLPPERPGGLSWPAQTQVWWANWGASAQAQLMTSTDWDVMLETALLHARVWGDGEVTVMAELRLRVAKFGATPEDRARLRMFFADADEKDSKRKPDGATARAKYEGLAVVPGGQSKAS